MTVYVLNTPEHYVVVRCHAAESEDVISTLREDGYICDEARPVDGLAGLVDVKAKKDGWSAINQQELRDLLVDKGFEVAN